MRDGALHDWPELVTIAPTPPLTAAGTDPANPAYKPEMGKLWLERGGVFVQANIRGGGEFGPVVLGDLAADEGGLVAGGGGFGLLDDVAEAPVVAEHAPAVAARLRGDADVFQHGGVRQDVGDLV